MCRGTIKLNDNVAEAYIKGRIEGAAEMYEQMRCILENGMPPMVIGYTTCPECNCKLGELIKDEN